MNEVHTPDVVLVLWMQSDDRTILMIKVFTFLAVLGKLQAFLTPYAFNFLVINDPAFHAQEGCDLPIVI